MSRAPSNPDALLLWQYSLDSVCVCMCGVCLRMPSLLWAEKGDQVLPAHSSWSEMVPGRLVGCQCGSHMWIPEPPLVICSLGTETLVGRRSC